MPEDPIFPYWRVKEAVSSKAGTSQEIFGDWTNEISLFCMKRKKNETGGRGEKT